MCLVGKKLVNLKNFFPLIAVIKMSECLSEFSTQCKSALKSKNSFLGRFF